MSTTITDVPLLQAPTTATTYDGTTSNGTITAVPPAGSDHRGGKLAHGHCRTLLPGLIDTHVHLRGSDEMRAATRANVGEQR